MSKTTGYTYNNRGLLAGMTLPETISTTYIRNDLGLITRIIDPNGDFWDKGYDQMGRLTSRTDPLSNKTSYAYDSRSRISTVTFPESSLQLTYDGSGKVVRRLYSDGTDLKYTYDDNGRLLTTNGLTLSYDSRGGIVGSNGLIITRDNVGRVSTMTLATGKTVTYNYNIRGLVSQVSDWVGGSTNLTYDDDGRLSSIARPNGITTAYTYDQDGRLVGIVEQKGGIISSISLTRNGVGEITSAARNVPLMPDPSAGTRSFTYDAASQVSGYTYDKMGRLTADDTCTYTWDLASRLTSYTEGGNTVSFEYDGTGMRTGRSQGGVSRNYVWNYALSLASVSVVREGGSDIRYYIPLPGGRLLHSIEASDNTRRFYHFDEMGTTLYLTNDAGTITDSYGISPYGEITGEVGFTDNPFTFIGAYGVMREGTSRLFYMRARYYDSTNSRFLTRDPVKSLYGKRLDLYAYAAKNPLGYIDPEGLDEIFLERIFMDWDTINALQHILFPPLDPVGPPPKISFPGSNGGGNDIDNVVDNLFPEETLTPELEYVADQLSPFVYITPTPPNPSGEESDAKTSDIDNVVDYLFFEETSTPELEHVGLYLMDTMTIAPPVCTFGVRYEIENDTGKFFRPITSFTDEFQMSPPPRLNFLSHPE